MDLGLSFLINNQHNSWSYFDDLEPGTFITRALSCGSDNITRWSFDPRIVVLFACEL